MLPILGVITLLLSIFLLLRIYIQQSESGRRSFWYWFIFFLIFAGVLFLTLSGRLHFLAAIATGLIPFAKKAVPLLRYVPLFRRWYQSRPAKQEKETEAPKNEITDQSNIEVQEAYRILGLAPGACKEDVIDAHKRLIQKLHPDHGGNDYLAAQINQAKDLILSHQEDS